MADSKFPEGKFMTFVKVGAKGQIVIPAEVREMFGIQPGASLMLLADRERGIAIPDQAQAAQILEVITKTMKGGMFDESH